MSKSTPQSKVNEVFALYESYGNADYIGEPVSQIEHMCQAAQMAEAEGYDNEVILSAFFHDMGHLFAQSAELEQMDGYGVMDHEKLGADYLRKLGFPEKVARLVESHVEAKRYLTFKNPEYFKQLSEASKKNPHFSGRSHDC